MPIASFSSFTDGLDHGDSSRDHFILDQGTPSGVLQIKFGKGGFSC